MSAKVFWADGRGVVHTIAEKAGHRVSTIRGANVSVCETPADVARAGAARVAAWLSAAVSARKRATLALAGGRTPEALYRLLAETPNRETIDWGRVEIFWGDERCVPTDHPDSNYRMAREALLRHVPIPGAQIHRMPSELADAEEAAMAYERALRGVFNLEADQFPSFDLLLLGMGFDGHTASLFPGSPALRERTRLVVAPWVETVGAHRLTLTMPALIGAANTLLLVSGFDKAATLRDVLEGRHLPERFPVQGLRDSRGSVTWLVDRDAASALGLPRRTDEH